MTFFILRILSNLKSLLFLLVQEIFHYMVSITEEVSENDKIKKKILNLCGPIFFEYISNKRNRNTYLSFISP